MIEFIIDSSIRKKKLMRLSKSAFFKIYELRYKIFCEKYHWIPENDLKLDIDKYDFNCHDFVDIRYGEIVSYFRILEKDFMIENEFKDIIFANHKIKENSIEVSRFIGNKKDISHLWNRVEGWCFDNNKKYVYAVVTNNVLEWVEGSNIEFEVVGRNNDSIVILLKANDR